jgi:L-histidine Nalpha-methyltransferase
MSIVKSNLAATDLHHGRDVRRRMERDLRAGLSAIRKQIPCKYLYDAHGSELFERICATPEYYPTRTEVAILEQSGADLMNFLGPQGGDLVELGSGSNLKIRKLLEAVESARRRRIRYVPVDISEACLLQATEELSGLHADVQIKGIVADFTCSLEMLAGSRRKMILFLGSTIGNFSADECAAFLEKVAAVMDRTDYLAIGLDMLKSIPMIESAYNDSAGVTAAFNLNLLRRLNREWGANFVLDAFEHVALFNHRSACIEMHLRAKQDMSVYLAQLGMGITLRQGETIRTEICRKFSRRSATEQFRAAGLRPVRWFTDPRQWFSVAVLQKTS